MALLFTNAMLNNLFKRNPKEIKPDWLVNPDVQTRYVFTSNGVEYYEFTNGYNMYYERYMAAQDRLNEIEQRCDKKYLDIYQDLLDDYLKKGDLVNIAILNKNLRDLREYVFNVNLLYNLAAVWYFDKNENPFTFDHEYCDKKIVDWKKDKEALSFFLQSPIREYLPQLNISKEDLRVYIMGLSLKELSTLKYHLSNQLKDEKNKDLISMLQLQIEGMEALHLTASQL